MGKEMTFKVQKTDTYEIYSESIKKFKEAMLERLADEMIESGELDEDKRFSYTIEDIPDKIVLEALKVTVQDAYDNLNTAYAYCSGVKFDDYFNSISLDCSEEDVRDCIYEAAAEWKKELNKENK